MCTWASAREIKALFVALDDYNERSERTREGAREFSLCTFSLECNDIVRPRVGSYMNNSGVCRSDVNFRRVFREMRCSGGPQETDCCTRLDMLQFANETFNFSYWTNNRIV